MLISTGISELYTQRLERYTTALRIAGNSSKNLQAMTDAIAAGPRQGRARLYC